MKSFKSITFIITLCFISTSIFAAPSKSKTAQIQKLLTVTKASAMSQQLSEQMLGMMELQIPEDKKSCFQKASKALKREMTDDKLTPLFIPVYDKHFTEKEIQDLVAFYNTPLGKKLLEKQPLIMQDSIAVSQQWGQQISSVLQKELQSCK